MRVGYRFGMEPDLERHDILITCDEVCTRLIQDRFAPILTKKMTILGSTVSAIDFAPDNAAEAIARVIHIQMETGCDLLVIARGMSVAPNDVARHGICLAGADEFHHESIYGVKFGDTAPSNQSQI